MAPLSPGKDTTTGHWELAGLVLKEPFPLYPEGFPGEVINAFENAIGRKVLGNIAASGTEIIEELGGKHIQTGFPIVYTSADSVFQVAAHEDIVPVQLLYQWCRTARREILTGKHAVGRVIARPFKGVPGSFWRTAGRVDYSLEPPAPVLTDLVKEKGLAVWVVGKVKDIFAGRGVTRHLPAAGNRAIMEAVEESVRSSFSGIMWATLVDLDMLYGHRNNVEGFAQALEEFDVFLGTLVPKLGPDDILVLTADHGCDPTLEGTDHTREYVPLLMYGKKVTAVNIGTRRSFADMGATVTRVLGCAPTRDGNSFAADLFKEGVERK